MTIADSTQHTLQLIGRTAAGCAIGLLGPGATLLDLWMMIRRLALSNDAREPSFVERSVVAILIAMLYWWCLGPLVTTATQVAMVGTMPMFEMVEIRLIVGGPISTHILNIARCRLAGASLCSSLAFRILHLIAVVSIRAPTSGCIFLILCLAGQRGLW